MLTTADNITNQQIKALREEAMAAGDYRQVAICDVALNPLETADPLTGEPLVDSDGNPITRGLARAKCAAVIAYAQGEARRGEAAE
jgi:hypothetical protein